MKKTLGLLILLLATTFDLSSPSLQIQSAIAKPPPWAPAHGYRRKHEDRDEDRREIHYYINDPVREERITDPILIVFNRLDSNRDGVITRREWDGTDVLFVRLDTNHDGVLTRPEYSHIDEERGILAGLYYKAKQKMASFIDWLF